MGSLGPPHLISLLLVVAVIAATCGFTVSAARRTKRRARGFFLLGVFCGFMAGVTLRRRRPGLKALGVIARSAFIRAGGEGAVALRLLRARL
jgi:hypothetical protein